MRVERVMDWMRREKAQALAGFGGLCLILSLILGHVDERVSFVLEVVSAIAFGVAIWFEQNSNARIFYGVVLAAAVIFIVMDFNITAHLSQARSLESFTSG